MIVTFVSQCQSRASHRTRRVLDAFANRIGNNTWQTVITEDGLNAVKILLRKSATKNTAVSCHRLRSRSRSDLIWIVGNRRQFNSQGFVPVNITKKELLNNQYENDWTYLPIVKGLVAIAALLHDWGKASALFQNKLKKNTRQGDPLRHEWISCLLLKALVQQSGNTDEGWLQLFVSGNLDEEMLKKFASCNEKKPLANLPPIAQLVGWLIITHHRLPFRHDPIQESEQRRETLSGMLKSISEEWGYRNGFSDPDYQARLKECFEFPAGLLSKSQPWQKQLKKWSKKLLDTESIILQLIESGAYRVLLHHARLCLMLGDHYYSSCDADKNWYSSIDLYANTDNKGLKQKLDEHLVNVSTQALKISQSLSRFTTEMGMAYDITSLKKKSPAGFEWQDKAVDSIQKFKVQHQQLNSKDYGWFIVNLASTGCGKTIANAKIMQSLSNSDKGLRYILALGLRTLTLQTGDEYRDRIGLKNDELAVIIGSAATKELHENIHKTRTQPTNEDFGSESVELLFDEDINFDSAPTAEFMDAVIPKHNIKAAENHKAFLYKPVLVCTIDHIIAATETIRGGKYILPSLRLLSSDLVIDEVDDFEGKDLIAIGRLIHLAGMLGRKVMISSATIPPALAEGFFNAYQEGWKLHCKFRDHHRQIACVWVDEFGSSSCNLDKNNSLEICQQYKLLHQEFICNRVKNLQLQPVKRKAFIVRCENALIEGSNKDLSAENYFSTIKKTACELHKKNHTVDCNTGKYVSFGLIRMANIPPCIELSKYLLEGEWPDNFTPRVMAYHSRQVLLLRHEQEKHLDRVLKRKETSGEMPQAFSDAVIGVHLRSTDADNILFILVATPVEEVGRDHDFDWAIIEPSSYRSIIQLSGRVRRHRTGPVQHPNVAIMQYNLRALRNDDRPAFCRPGYETFKNLKLETHDLCKLVDEVALASGINSIPRIEQPEKLKIKNRLADIEHQSIINILTNYTKFGPQCLQGWLTECWWMTAVPRQLNRFRESSPDLTLYLVWQNGRTVFCEKDEKGHFVEREQLNNIERTEQINEIQKEHLWLDRDYEKALRRLLELENIENESQVNELMYRKSKRFGEITLLDTKGSFLYSDQFGIAPR